MKEHSFQGLFLVQTMTEKWRTIHSQVTSAEVLSVSSEIPVLFPNGPLIVKNNLLCCYCSWQVNGAICYRPCTRKQNPSPKVYLEVIKMCCYLLFKNKKYKI